MPTSDRTPIARRALPFALVLGLMMAACADGSAPAPATEGPAATPAPTTGMDRPSAEALAGELTPPGARELGRAEVGGALQVTFTVQASVDDLAVFWEWKLDSLGLDYEPSSVAGGGASYVFGDGAGSILALPGEEEGTAMGAVSVVVTP